MGQLWKRDAWNDIIRRVNDLAQNPDDGCDPVDPLQEVGTKHKWSKTDIQKVQNTLVEICKDNSFSAELRLWAQDVIDEIEDAIAKGWCDCEPDCLEQCSNAQDTVVNYAGSFTVTACRNCGDCANSTCPPICTQEERDAVTAKGDLANSKLDDWADAWAEYCTLKDAVEDLQDELDALESQLSSLEDTRDAACASGSSASCSSAQAAVDAKQAEVDAKQTELDQKTQERDQKLSEADNYLHGAERAAVESIELADAVGQEVIQTPYSTFISGDSSWTDWDCDKLGPDCLGRDARRCDVGWSIQKRTTTVFDSGWSYTGSWQTVMGGGFTRDGSPFVSYLPGCGGVSKYACSSCGADPCSTGCGASHIHEIRCVLGYPHPTGEECCD